MAGVLFVVSVPTRQHELNLTENPQGKSLSSNTINEDFNRQFSDSKSESFHSLSKIISATRETLCETDDNSVSYVSRTPKECSTATINTDGNQERSSSIEARLDKRADRSYEIAVKPEGSRRDEDMPKGSMKKGIADLTDVFTGQSMPMEKVSRNTVVILY